MNSIRSRFFQAFLAALHWVLTRSPLQKRLLIGTTLVTIFAAGPVVELAKDGTNASFVGVHYTSPCRTIDEQGFTHYFAPQDWGKWEWSALVLDDSLPVCSEQNFDHTVVWRDVFASSIGGFTWAIASFDAVLITLVLWGESRVYRDKERLWDAVDAGYSARYPSEDRSTL